MVTLLELDPRYPPIPAGGSCFVCGKERAVPKGTWARAAAAADPFCSTACCRNFHKVPLRLSADYLPPEWNG